MEAAAVAAQTKVARCPRCKTQVAVKTMASVLLLGEPDEKVEVYDSHSHQGMLCTGSREEVDP